MDLFPFDKIATLVIFLGALGLLWLLVQRHKGGLSSQLARGKRMRLTETTALGPTDRAMILTVDRQEFLILKIKGAGIALHPLTAQTETRMSEDAA
jgi:hypothetical protein